MTPHLAPHWHGAPSPRRLRCETGSLLHATCTLTHPISPSLSLSLNHSTTQLARSLYCKPLLCSHYSPSLYSIPPSATDSHSYSCLSCPIRFCHLPPSLCSLCSLQFVCMPLPALQAHASSPNGAHSHIHTDLSLARCLSLHLVCLPRLPSFPCHAFPDCHAPRPCSQTMLPGHAAMLQPLGQQTKLRVDCWL